jgi:uncharacterized cupredoxin-like copper-binding protein
MRLLWPIIAAALAVLLVGCGAPLRERTLTIVATEMSFAPSQVEAEVGEQVFVTLSNKGKLAHNLVIELPSGDRTVAANDGVDAVVAFPAQSAGSFRFYCSVPGHEAMTGVIEIRAP